ncbi:AAA family ATPase [Agrobacterium rhizogenes]|uniref:ATP-binding protein n=1 Tax=Rhizobium rhizogenes TaxID=359 RepID=UPI001572C0E7|nr:ATP-binding protein [Rhizobium rhizogenes]NTI16095.1 AAA family ATPase [Rhizobium rhizogenes]
MSTTSPFDELERVFKNLRIEHCFMNEAHQAFDNLRSTRRRIMENTSLSKEARCVTLFADTQSGKTTTVLAYLERNIVDYCYEIELFDRDTPRITVAALQRVVVHISVSGASTLMSLLEDILRAYGDPRPETGNLGSKKHRILNYINEFQTELLIFDEMNHLRIGAASIHARSEATRVHNTLKDFLIGGCPIVFVGTSEARRKVFLDKQIRARCAKQLFIGPLNFKNPTHRKAFEDYVGLLGLHLAASGLFKKRSNFVNEEVCPRLFIACGGYLGHAANLIERAAQYAIDEGASRVGFQHLVAATEDYTVFNGLAKFNSFRKPVVAKKTATQAEATHV